MKWLCKSWLLGALALLIAAPAALAEERVPFRQEELDQMLAPVALYPDPLLSQVLMASTYPLEVVQAARWSRANPALKGQDAVNAVESMDWEPSVKSLTAFPQVLAMMSEKLEWTERLGEAFLAQQADVMNTVQGLRQRAEAAGHLRSNEQMRVERQHGAIVIEPPAPGVVYVPYYDPALVYGPWWWPAYPPVAWAPPPAYYVVPPYPPAWLWGSGIVLSTGFFFGHFDWPHRHVQVRHLHPVHAHAHPVHAHRVWRHNPVHRRGVPYRSAEARQRFEQHRAQPRAADARPGHREGFRREERRDAASGPRQPGGGANRSSASPTASPAGSSPPPARAGSADRRSHAPAGTARPEPRLPAQPGAGAQAQRPAHPERVDRSALRAGDRESPRQHLRQPERRAPPAVTRATGPAPAVRADPRPPVIQGGAGHAARGLPQHAARERIQSPRAAERAAPHAAPAASRAPRVHHHPRGNGAARGNERSRERSADRSPGRRS
jgi:hypothetical protein